MFKNLISTLATLAIVLGLGGCAVTRTVTTDKDGATTSTTSVKLPDVEFVHVPVVPYCYACRQLPPPPAVVCRPVYRGGGVWTNVCTEMPRWLPDVHWQRRRW